ncbi:MAG: HD domain-containing protein [Candidatus Marsarchaeota archaeon]|nr:HD domain-containing protein [Candidatus Marsarchaeota archaeon]
METHRNVDSYFEWKVKLVRSYMEEHMPILPYHNRIHAEGIVTAIDMLASMEKISKTERYLLETAGYLHDIIYVPFAKDNEERSAEVAGKLLSELNYSDDEIRLVQSLIMATKLPTNPKTPLEQIICDADVDNLGRDDFFEKTENLRNEFGVLDKHQWCVTTLEFMKRHRYYTESAQTARNNGKEDNMDKLVEMIENPYLNIDEAGHQVALMTKTGPQYALANLCKEDAFAASVNLFAIEMNRLTNNSFGLCKVKPSGRPGDLLLVLEKSIRKPDDLDKDTAHQLGLELSEWGWNEKGLLVLHFKEAPKESIHLRNIVLAD